MLDRFLHVLAWLSWAAFIIFPLGETLNKPKLEAFGVGLLAAGLVVVPTIIAHYIIRGRVWLLPWQPCPWEIKNPAK